MVTIVIMDIIIVIETIQHTATLVTVLIQIIIIVLNQMVIIIIIILIIINLNEISMITIGKGIITIIIEIIEKVLTIN
jgi:hypothetical protein